MSTQKDAVAPWLWSIRPGGRGQGFLRKFAHHSVVFVDHGPKQLVITFDNLAEMNEQSLHRAPWSYDFFAKRGASVLGVMARRGMWYRDPDLIAYLQDLSDTGFFKSFDRVLITGNSMGGFGALAFSPLVPGADILSFSPQTTLNKTLVPWETRFEKAWASDWSLPYSDARTTLGQAGNVTIIYDPIFTLDTQHVDRIDDADALKLKAWYASHKSPVFLRRLGMLKPVSEAALAGELTAGFFYKLYRTRRTTPWYRNSLRNHARDKNHPAFAKRLSQLYGPISKSEKSAADDAARTKGKMLIQKSRDLQAAVTTKTPLRDLTIVLLTYPGDPFLPVWKGHAAKFIPDHQIQTFGLGGPVENALPLAAQTPWPFLSTFVANSTLGAPILVMRSCDIPVSLSETQTNPFELLAQDGRSQLAPFGITCVHHRVLTPAKLDLEQPILAQRPYFRLGSASTRTMLVREPAQWNADGSLYGTSQFNVSEDVASLDISGIDHDLGCLLRAKAPALYPEKPSVFSSALDQVATLVPSERSPLSYRVLQRIYGAWATACEEADPASPSLERTDFVLSRRLFSFPKSMIDIV